MRSLVVVCAIAFAILTPSLGSARQEGERTKYLLVGTVGTLAVHVRLTREGAALSGDYTYDPAKAALRPEFDALSLAGTIAPDGSVALNESSFRGDTETPTGKFAGKLTSGSDGARFEGTWSKPDGSSSLPVSLAEPRPSAGSVRIVKVQWAEKDARFKPVLSISYPRLDATDARSAKFNTAVAAKISKEVADYKSTIADDERLKTGDLEGLALDITYEVTASTASLVSVRFDAYTDFGGAHPATYVFVVNYDLAKGRELTFADLFKKGSGYARVVSGKCLALLRSNKDFAPVDAVTVDDMKQWSLTPRALRIALPTAHVLGDTVDAFIPYADLGSILQPGGPASQMTAR